MSDLDRRLHAYRPDLADAALEGFVEAQRFTTGQPGVVRVGATDLRRAPDEATGIDTQLLFGETVTVFEVRDDWAWVRAARDGYVGYTAAEALGEPWGAATHEVAALRTLVYREASMKTPVQHALSMTSAVRVVQEQAGYGRLAGGGWIFLGHLAPNGVLAEDPVATALRFVGLPYRWGGKESVGLDCSALVQIALQRSGRACPRDSDMQAAALGRLLDDEAELVRGDLLFFPGHVALALDAERVVHATAHSMDVCIERLEDVTQRVLAESGRGLTAHRRL